MGDRGKRQIDRESVAEHFSALAICNTHLHDLEVGLPIHPMVEDGKQRAEVVGYGVGTHVYCLPTIHFHCKK